MCLVHQHFIAFVSLLNRWMNVILLPLSQWIITTILVGLDILMHLWNSQNTEERWARGMFSLNVQNLLKKLNIYKILWNESEYATIFLQTVCKCLIAPKSFFKVNKNKNIHVFLLIPLIFFKSKQFFYCFFFPSGQKYIAALSSFKCIISTSICKTLRTN